MQNFKQKYLKLIGERIRKYRIMRDLTQAELAEKAGFTSRTSINKIEAGLTDIATDKLKLIADALNVTPGDLLNNDADIVYYSYPNIVPLQITTVPVLGDVACGEPRYASEDKSVYLPVEMNLNADFALYAKGDSMEGARIYDGDIVFIRKQESVDNGDIAVVIIGDEATLKRVYRDEDAQELRLVAENPRYKTIVLSGAELEQVHILGKAVAFMSTLDSDVTKL